MKLRLLPVAIIALVLTLGVKLGGVWTGVVTPSLAQQAPGGGQREAAPKATEKAPAKAAEPKAGEKANAGGAPKDAASAPSGRTASGLPSDPALFSQGEIDLLQKLSARRNELEKWTQELSMREGLLKAAEQRIDRKVGELRQIQSRIQKMLRQYDKEQEEKLKSLVKIYETMKPKEAARIFMELDMPVLLDVVERMKEAKSASIISRLEPEKAKNLTTELVKRRKIGADGKAALPRGAEGEPLPSSGPAPAQPPAG